MLFTCFSIKTAKVLVNSDFSSSLQSTNMTHFDSINHASHYNLEDSNDCHQILTASPTTTGLIGTFVTGDSLALKDLNKSIEAFNWSPGSNYTYKKVASKNEEKLQNGCFTKYYDSNDTNRNSVLECIDGTTYPENNYLESIIADLGSFGFKPSSSSFENSTHAATDSGDPVSQQFSCQQYKKDTTSSFSKIERFSDSFDSAEQIRDAAPLSSADLQKYLRFIRLRPAICLPTEKIYNTANQNTKDENHIGQELEVTKISKNIQTASHTLLSFLISEIEYTPPLGYSSDQKFSLSPNQLKGNYNLNSSTKKHVKALGLNIKKHPKAGEKKLPRYTPTHHQKNIDPHPKQHEHESENESLHSSHHSHHGKLSNLKSKMLSSLHHNSHNDSSSKFADKTFSSSARSSVSSVRSAASMASQILHSSKNSSTDLTLLNNPDSATSSNNTALQESTISSFTVNSSNEATDSSSGSAFKSSDGHPVGHKSLGSPTTIKSPSLAAQLRTYSAPVPQALAPSSSLRHLSAPINKVKSKTPNNLSPAQTHAIHNTVASPKIDTSSHGNNTFSNNTSANDSKHSLPTLSVLVHANSIKSSHSFNGLSKLLHYKKHRHSRNNSYGQSLNYSNKSNVNSMHCSDQTLSHTNSSDETADGSVFAKAESQQNDSYANIDSRDTISPTDSLNSKPCRVESRKSTLDTADSEISEVKTDDPKVNIKKHLSNASSAESLRSGSSHTSLQKLKGFFQEKATHGSLAKKYTSSCDSNSFSDTQVNNNASAQKDQVRLQSQPQYTKPKAVENVQTLCPHLQNFDRPSVQILNINKGLNIHSNKPVLRIQGQIVVETTGHEYCKHSLQKLDNTNQYKPRKNSQKRHHHRIHQMESPALKPSKRPINTRGNHMSKSKAHSRLKKTGFKVAHESSFNPYLSINPSSNCRVRHNSAVSQSSRHSSTRTTSPPRLSPSFKPHEACLLKQHTVQSFSDIVIDPQFPHSFIDIETIIKELFSGSWHEFMETSFKVVAIPFINSKRKCSFEDDQFGKNDKINFEGRAEGEKRNSSCFPSLTEFVEKEIMIELRLVPCEPESMYQYDDPGLSSFSTPMEPGTEASGLSEYMFKDSEKPQINKPIMSQEGSQSTHTPKSPAHKSHRLHKPESLPQKSSKQADLLSKTRNHEDLDSEHSTFSHLSSPKKDISSKPFSSHEHSTQDQSAANGDSLFCKFEDVIQLKDIAPYRCVLGQDWLKMLFVEFEDRNVESTNQNQKTSKSAGKVSTTNTKSKKRGYSSLSPKSTFTGCTPEVNGTNKNKHAGKAYFSIG